VCNLGLNGFVLSTAKDLASFAWIILGKLAASFKKLALKTILATFLQLSDKQVLTRKFQIGPLVGSLEYFPYKAWIVFSLFILNHFANYNRAEYI
jgi:hypothetical protein